MNGYRRDHVSMVEAAARCCGKSRHALCATPTLLDHRSNISEVVGKVTSGNVYQVQREPTVEKGFAH